MQIDCGRDKGWRFYHAEWCAFIQRMIFLDDQQLVWIHEHRIQFARGGPILAMPCAHRAERMKVLENVKLVIIDQVDDPGFDDEPNPYLTTNKPNVRPAPKPVRA